MATPGSPTRRRWRRPRICTARPGCPPTSRPAAARLPTAIPRWEREHPDRAAGGRRSSPIGPARSGLRRCRAAAPDPRRPVAGRPARWRTGSGWSVSPSGTLSHRHRARAPACRGPRRPGSGCRTRRQHASPSASRPPARRLSAAATSVASCPTRRHPSARARSVNTDRARIASLVSVHVRAWHRGSGAAPDPLMPGQHRRTATAGQVPHPRRAPPVATARTQARLAERLEFDSPDHLLELTAVLRRI